MALKVLFVGGVYPVEFSLFKESQGNLDLSVLFVSGNGAAMPDAINIVKPRMASSSKLVSQIKAEFNPDITIYRSWCPEKKWMVSGDILWAQEIFPTINGETKTIPGSVGESFETIAFQNKVYSEKTGQLWLPYCVSKYWEMSGLQDIPIMLATSVPSDSAAAVNKRRSLDILAKPIAENIPELLHAYNGYYGRLESATYLKPCLKPSFSTVDMTSFINRAKIYLSPTSIWYDEGSISHKTIQAMACGCLVFTNNYPGIEEIVGKDGDTIVYCNTPEETLEKAQYYLAHDKERLEIANRGMELIHQKYSWLSNLTRLHTELINANKS